MEALPGPPSGVLSQLSYLEGIPNWLRRIADEQEIWKQANDEYTASLIRGIFEKRNMAR